MVLYRKTQLVLDILTRRLSQIAPRMAPSSLIGRLVVAADRQSVRPTCLSSLVLKPHHLFAIVLPIG